MSSRQSSQQQQQKSQRYPNTTSTAATSSGQDDAIAAAAVPTLRVMRLQKPELHVVLPDDHTNALQSSLCLPDSLGVYVGETFTAYLGILNPSPAVPITKLSVQAVLQSPTHRWNLHSALEQVSTEPVPPQGGVDAIVSHAIEEPGPHILRVEVGYYAGHPADGSSGMKTFRKFYRFAVEQPLQVTVSKVVRFGDATCIVCVQVEYSGSAAATNEVSPRSNSNNAAASLVITDAEFVPTEGLTATLVGNPHSFRSCPTRKSDGDELSALELFDQSGWVSGPGACRNYVFSVQATSKEAQLRGLAGGDCLGQVSICWRKAMGEHGRIWSSTIEVPWVEWPPPLDAVNDDLQHVPFVVYRSGLSVDVATAAANRNRLTPAQHALLQALPVTVEPIDPPRRMTLQTPQTVQFLVVNHSEQAMHLQLQFGKSTMIEDGADHLASGETATAAAAATTTAAVGQLSVCGTSATHLGEVPPHGGSTVATLRFLALQAGLLTCRDCHVRDLISGRSISQPPLFQVFVDMPAEARR